MLTLEESLNNIIAFHDKLMNEYEESKAQNNRERETLKAQQVLVVSHCLGNLEKSHVIENDGGKWKVVGRIETIIHIEKNTTTEKIK
jgi:hypothetical protein